jgi:hypothetical protein
MPHPRGWEGRADIPGPSVIIRSAPRLQLCGELLEACSAELRIRRRQILAVPVLKAMK